MYVYLSKAAGIQTPAVCRLLLGGAVAAPLPGPRPAARESTRTLQAEGRRCLTGLQPRGLLIPAPGMRSQLGYVICFWTNS